MTKRKGLLDVDVNGLLNGLTITSTNSTAPKEKIKQFEVLDHSMLVSDALETITRQMKVSGNRRRTTKRLCPSCRAFSEYNKRKPCC